MKDIKKILNIIKLNKELYNVAMVENETLKKAQENKEKLIDFRNEDDKVVQVKQSVLWEGVRAGGMTCSSAGALQNVYPEVFKVAAERERLQKETAQALLAAGVCYKGSDVYSYLSDLIEIQHRTTIILVMAMFKEYCNVDVPDNFVEELIKKHDKK